MTLEPKQSEESWLSKLKEFLWYLVSGKNPESERKKQEMINVLDAMKEEKKK